MATAEYVFFVLLFVTVLLLFGLFESKGINIRGKIWIN